MRVKLSEQVRPNWEVSSWVYQRILAMEHLHEQDIIDARTRGRCKDCRFYIKDGINPWACDHPRVAETPVRDENQDSCGYSYDEGGYIEPEPNFGCIHFINFNHFCRNE